MPNLMASHRTCSDFRRRLLIYTTLAPAGRSPYRGYLCQPPICGHEQEGHAGRLRFNEAVCRSARQCPDGWKSGSGFLKQCLSPRPQSTIMISLKAAMFLPRQNSLPIPMNPAPVMSAHGRIVSSIKVFCICVSFHSDHSSHFRFIISCVLENTDRQIGSIVFKINPRHATHHFEVDSHGDLYDSKNRCVWHFPLTERFLTMSSTPVMIENAFQVFTSFQVTQVRFVSPAV